MKIKLIIWLVVLGLINITFELPSNDTSNSSSSNTTTVNTTLNFFELSHKLNSTQLTNINQELSINENYLLFLIRIQNEGDVLINSAAVLNALANDFFSKKCNTYPNMCENGFLIDIYLKKRNFFIIPGSKSTEKLDSNYIARILSSITADMILNHYDEGIIKAMRLIKYKYLDNAVNLSIPKDNYEVLKSVFLFAIPVIFLILLAVVLFLMFVENSHKEFESYLITSVGLWYDIKKSEDGYVEFNNCILCLQPSIVDKSTLKKFDFCRHRYHAECIIRWNINETKCCPCAFDDSKLDETQRKDSRSACLTLEDIKAIWAICLNAFRKDSIYEGLVNQKELVDKYNEENEIFLEDLMWVLGKNYEEYRISKVKKKVQKAIKMICCVMSFWPSDTISKKGKLIKKILAARGGSGGGY